MKAKVLGGFYIDGSGYKPLRLYFEPDFEQAEKDRELLDGNGTLAYILQDVEVYGNHKISSE